MNYPAKDAVIAFCKASKRVFGQLLSQTDTHNKLYIIHLLLSEKDTPFIRENFHLGRNGYFIKEIWVNKDDESEFSAYSDMKISASSPPDLVDLMCKYLNWMKLWHEKEVQKFCIEHGSNYYRLKNNGFQKKAIPHKELIQDKSRLTSKWNYVANKQSSPSQTNIHMDNSKNFHLTVSDSISDCINTIIVSLRKLLSK